jgi:hypothetical protein
VLCEFGGRGGVWVLNYSEISEYVVLKTSLIEIYTYTGIEIIYIYIYIYICILYVYLNFRIGG